MTREELVIIDNMLETLNAQNASITSLLRTTTELQKQILMLNEKIERKKNK